MRFTLRRNGRREATIRVTYYVPVDLVDWLRNPAHGAMTRTAAERFVREHVAKLADGWHAAVVVDGDAQVWHVDEVDVHVDHVDLYVGPGVE